MEFFIFLLLLILAVIGIRIIMVRAVIFLWPVLRVIALVLGGIFLIMILLVCLKDCSGFEFLNNILP